MYLRKEVQESGESPKLASQAEGPYQVLETDGRTFVLRQGTDRNRVSSDRVTPAPSPSETTGIPTQDSIDDQTPRGEDEVKEAGFHVHRGVAVVGRLPQGKD